ncbi:MAG: CDC27 family protein [Myxococcota bacterium]
MLRRTHSLCAVIVFLAAPSLTCPAFAATDLTGDWEVQSMGGDRAVEIQQKGKKIVAHRVLWPEFEGEKYKLEHLYRGTIRGDKIRGELLVKEDELPDYEVLRAFRGKIKSNATIVLDGLPMKRTGGAKAAAQPPETRTPAAPGPVEAPSRPSEPPAYSQAPPPPPGPAAPPPPPVAMADAGTTKTPAPTAAAPSGADDPGATLFANIMGTPGMGGLFQVSNRITLPDGSAKISVEADKLYKAGQYTEALAKYEEASSLGASRSVRLLHRMGRCQLELEKYAEAVVLLRRAARLDPGNRKIRRDYKKAKQRAGAAPAQP